MQDLWNTLEERTRAWSTLGRQGVADAIWEDYVSLRFARTGDPLALEYLRPYLNHASRATRLRALDVAARVFEGRGPRAVEALSYFTTHPDPFLRDRAVIVVGAAVTGSPDTVILDVLAPYLDDRNQYVRKLALVALGKASSGQASERVLAEIRRVAEGPGPREDEVEMAVAAAFAGRPNDDVYMQILRPESERELERDNAAAMAVLVRGASDGWYQRACVELFEPRLHTAASVGWQAGFFRRDGVLALCYAAPGRGMEPLRRMLHVRGERCSGYAMLKHAPECFAGADPEANFAPLAELAASGDVPAQRIAAVCLGRLMFGGEDAGTIGLLREVADAKSPAVRAAALTGLGLAARSSCDGELHRLCIDRERHPETATEAIRALGMLSLGSGRREVFEDILGLASEYAHRPIASRKYSRPLAACYRAIGLLYLGTGSLEPVEFLLEVLARPRAGWSDEYRWVAARALTMIEFSEAALGWPYILFT